jgi:hypothetical protein
VFTALGTSRSFKRSFYTRNRIWRALRNLTCLWTRGYLLGLRKHKLYFYCNDRVIAGVRKENLFRRRCGSWHACSPIHQTEGKPVVMWTQRPTKCCGWLFSLKFCIKRQVQYRQLILVAQWESSGEEGQNGRWFLYDSGGKHLLRSDPSTTSHGIACGDTTSAMANTSTSRFDRVVHRKEREIIRCVITRCEDVFWSVSRTPARVTLTRPERPRGN